MARFKAAESKLLKSPAFFMFSQGIIICALIMSLPQCRVRVDADSHTYTDFFKIAASQGGNYFQNILTNFRTPGYPVFLSLVKTATGDYEIIPLCQYLLHFFAVIVFWRSLVKLGFREWTAALTASPLFFAKAVTSNCMYVMTDSPGISLAVLSMGCLISAVAEHGRKNTILLLAISTFVTCQVRPAYLVLLPLFPVMAFILFFVRRIHTKERRNAEAANIVMTVIMACFIPFLMYCSLRKVVTGSFGYTNFGGYNIIGITGQFLTPDIVPKLSPEMRPLASDIINERERLKLKPPISDYYKARKTYGWQVYHFARLQYNTVIWKLFNGYAKSKKLPPTKANVLFLKLSREIIQIKPLSYSQIVFDTLLISVSRYFEEEILDDIFFIIYAVALIVSMIAAGMWMGANNSLFEFTPSAMRSSCMEMCAVISIATVFFAANSLLIALVEFPLMRYVYCAGIFLPCIITVAIAQPWMLMRAKER